MNDDLLIISGGQTGVDQAGLYAAKENGLMTGGYMPKGFRTNIGNKPEFQQLFGMKATASWKYPPRTASNVRWADMTIIMGNLNSPGCKLTKRFCQQYQKPMVLLDKSLNQDEIQIIIRNYIIHNPSVINIAGNREETNPGIYKWAFNILNESFKAIKLYK